MTDIVPQADGLDLGTLDTSSYRAANILSVQQGALEYAPDLGIDLAFFLSEGFAFQNDSFKAYLIERLASFGINVSSIASVVESLFESYTVNIVPEETSSGLIAR